VDLAVAVDGPVGAGEDEGVPRAAVVAGGSRDLGACAADPQAVGAGLLGEERRRRASFGLAEIGGP